MRRLVILALALAMAGPAPPAHAAPLAEQRASALFDEVAESPARLRIFLQAMPKGADLHNHLSGGVYAEDYISWAAQARYCVDAAEPRLVPPPCPAARAVSGLGERDPFAFAALVDGLSTRGLPRETSGHDQFFKTFDRFWPIAEARVSDGLVAIRRLAAGDHVSYVELIHNPNALTDYTMAGPAEALDEAGLADAYRRELPGVQTAVAKASAELDRDEAQARKVLGCGGGVESAECRVQIRYLAWGARALPPAQAFRSLILAFALADRDPRVAGVNIVEPEDARISLRDYDLQMAMFRFLERIYPHVRRSLHAGELAFGAVPPGDMRDHIRKAIEIGGAQRIGHGTSIAFETDAPATLARMARERIAVEINLTSNDLILGVKGAQHPLGLYRRAGVPVVLSTDDEGVLRTDLTAEYMRAAREHGLRYTDLKGLARASLEYAFLPGASLWKDGRIGAPVEACATRLDAASCRDFLRSSEKARMQADLEARFVEFENDVTGWAF